MNVRYWSVILPQTSRFILNVPKPVCGIPSCLQVSIANVHTSSSLQAYYNSRSGPRKWTKYNKIIYPPQAPDEERRPAYVCHLKENIKYSPWKMWYIACMVRGMTVDEAIKQLSFVSKKGAKYVKETILEAQELAVQEHNVEFKSNLWVAESHVGKGMVMKGMRRHAKMRVGKVEYFHCHYFVRLEEGTPPKDFYYHSRKLSGGEMLEKWLKEMRTRKIVSSL